MVTRRSTHFLFHPAILNLVSVPPKCREFPPRAGYPRTQVLIGKRRRERRGRGWKAGLECTCNVEARRAQTRYYTHSRLPCWATSRTVICTRTDVRGRSARRSSCRFLLAYHAGYDNYMTSKAAGTVWSWGHSDDGNIREPIEHQLDSLAVQVCLSKGLLSCPGI